MSQANCAPTTACFTKPFEELPLFTHWVNGERLTAALIDGEFEITYSKQDATWWISDVWIQTDNHRHGNNARTARINLDADTDERLYLSILDSLTEAYCDLIDEEIADELAFQGIRLVA